SGLSCVKGEIPAIDRALQRSRCPSPNSPPIVSRLLLIFLQLLRRFRSTNSAPEEVLLIRISLQGAKVFMAHHPTPWWQFRANRRFATPQFENLSLLHLQDIL